MESLMTSLFERSVEIILRNQSPSGAYVASPSFPTYQYCWFRDGSFIAYAMDLVGQPESAARFHAWAAAAVNARTDLVQRAVTKARRGGSLTGGDILHTRYTLDGQDALGEAWPNFQFDGFGTWLWALSEHARLGGGVLPPEWLQAAGLVADYLAALWARPCYDCWEEFPDHVHAHTLAAIYGGLEAYGHLTGADQVATLAALRQFIFDRLLTNGRFVKYAGSTAVDASLLGLATPYRVVEPGDPVMRATVAQIKADLECGGGLHRYAADTYYGGGEWVLLTAWLGWYYAEIGEAANAQAALAWVEAQADDGGQLPEQVPARLNDAHYLAPWRARWGEIAKPLLWSHAQYLIAAAHLYGRAQS
jgi:GH15 family glucan-1,4-alpha-glucosidase